MSIADKLTTIANNVPLVYEAGKAAGGGGVPVEEKDVNFWDYDGTLLYSYTLEEAQALTELPPLPDLHDGLVCQGWNWTLQEVKSFGLPVDVGAMYATDDGKTRIKIFISSMLASTAFLHISGAGFTVDWGDGITETYSSAQTEVSHNYSDTGEYTIKVWGEGEDRLQLGRNTAAPLVGRADKQTSCFCRELYIGNGADISDGAMNLSKELEKVTIPNGMTVLNSNCFNSCTRLKAIVLPASVTEVEASALQNCASLLVLSTAPGIVTWGSGAVRYNYPTKRIAIGPNTESFGHYFCQATNGIRVVHVPASVKSFGSNCYYTADSIAEIHFHGDAPPTLGNSSCFAGLMSDGACYVPAASLETYQNATNYAGIADRMVGV